MESVNLPALLKYLEVAVIVLASSAFVWGVLLIRYARHLTDSPAPPPPAYLPCTPLTRESIAIGRRRHNTPAKRRAFSVV